MIDSRSLILLFIKVGLLNFAWFLFKCIILSTELKRNNFNNLMTQNHHMLSWQHTKSIQTN